MAQKRLTMCAGQGFRIPPIIREYSKDDRVWFPKVSVFGDSPSMYPYKKYVPVHVDGGES